MVAPGLPGALKIAKPFVPAAGPAWQWSLVGSSLGTIDSPLRCAPLLSGLPAKAPVADAVATASVTATPPVIILRTCSTSWQPAPVAAVGGVASSSALPVLG